MEFNCQYCTKKIEVQPIEYQPFFLAPFIVLPATIQQKIDIFQDLRICNEDKPDEELCRVVGHVMGVELAKATLNSGIKLGLMTTVDVAVMDSPYSTTYLPVPLLRKVNYIDVMISFMWTMGLVHPNPHESYRRALLERLPLPLPLSELLINADEVERFSQCLALRLRDNHVQHNSHTLARAINRWIRVCGHAIARTNEPIIHDRTPIEVFEAVMKGNISEQKLTFRVSPFLMIFYNHCVRRL